MAYTPTAWVGGTSGTEFTASRMNNLELGVSNAHADITSLTASLANKITYPGGGFDGNILTKSGTSTAWSDVGGNTLSTDTVTGNTTLSNASKDVVEVNSASAVTITLPAGINAGRTFEIYQAGDGQVTVVPDTGVTLRGAPVAPTITPGFKTPAKYGSVFVRCRLSAAAPAPPATNLVMRFKGDDLSGANGSVVSSWPESSGQGHPAAAQGTTANQPVVLTNAGGTGHKGVTFDGVNDYLSLSGTALGVAQNRAGLTVFAVLAITGAVSTGTRTILGLSSGSSATSHRVVVGAREASGGLGYAGGRRLDADTLATIAGGGFGSVQNTVLTARFVYSTSDLYIYKDGTLSNSSTTFQTDGSTSNTASLAGVIGADAAATTGNFQGTLMELLVYNDADTTGALRQQVHSYILQTYGIAASDALTAAEFVVSGGVV